MILSLIHKYKRTQRADSCANITYYTIPDYMATTNCCRVKAELIADVLDLFFRVLADSESAHMAEQLNPTP